MLEGGDIPADNNDIPPPLMDMFINSTDTLQRREIPQRIPPDWSEKPPLFRVHVQHRRHFWRGPEEEDVTEDEDPKLLKGMIRKGIPGPLRCAVWISNVIQSAYPHQSLEQAHEYRTLAKVRILDHAYDSLWKTQLKEQDMCRVDFGDTTFWENKNVTEYEGVQSLEKVLYALRNLFGSIEEAPIIPTLATICLSYMSESYAFCTLREMIKDSTWYFAISQSEHRAYRRAFLAILGKLHPHTLETLKEKGFEDQFTNTIFQDFFTTILADHQVHRIMDIFSLEGTKCLFRFGVALAVLYQREWKEKYIYEFETSWWDGLIKFCNSSALNFEVLVKKAYGVHGKGIRQRFRFPRRPILARIIQLEEDAFWKERLEDSTDLSANLIAPKPLGLVPAKQPIDPDREPEIPKLAEPTMVRTKLAEWLPLSLRFTNMQLIYSTNHHGRTLENLYRHVANTRRTIMLIEPISTKKEMVVGMFAPQTWHPSTRVYGDGSCFLFKVVENKPDGETNCWKWHPKELKNLLASDSLEEDVSHHSENQTALLEQFQVSTNNYISMGGNSNGTSGLRLNEDLTKGESAPASGFDNEPLAGEMFEVGLVEVYQLVRELDGRAVH